MTINNLKELKQLIRLCQQTGVTTIEVDNIKLQIPVKTRQRKSLVMTDIPEANLRVPQYNGIPSEPDKIATDELTDDQLLFYSAVPHSEQQ